MLSLGQAARLVRTSKTTLKRAIKDGRLSATRRDDGGYRIDPEAGVFKKQPQREAAAHHDLTDVLQPVARQRPVLGTAQPALRVTDPRDDEVQAGRASDARAAASGALDSNSR
jgi:excisionase family DNA binding protein